MINLLLFCIIHSYLVMDDYLAIHFEIGAKFVLIIVVGFSLKKKKKRLDSISMENVSKNMKQITYM